VLSGGWQNQGAVAVDLATKLSGFIQSLIFRTACRQALLQAGSQPVK